jgi:hypothetical protein
MNQLFNPVNYFEFPVFEALRRHSIPPSYFSYRAWKQKSRRGIPARGGFLIDSFNLRQVEGIERRLVDYRRRSKPLIGLVSGKRFPGHRSEQSIHFTCVIAHLL